MRSKYVAIYFYVILGSGLLLLRNEVLHKSQQPGCKNLLIIPAGIGSNDGEERFLQAYTDGESEASLRTYLQVIPMKSRTLTAHFVALNSLMARQVSEDKLKFGNLSDGKIAKRLALKLQLFLHLPFGDMCTICESGRSPPIFRQSLRAVVAKCTTCKSTGRPLRSRKLSFSKLLDSFNKHVQLDHMFITELSDQPILHMVDMSTSFSVPVFTMTTDFSGAAQAFEDHWCNIHGPGHHVGRSGILKLGFPGCAQPFWCEIGGTSGPPTQQNQRGGKQERPRPADIPAIIERRRVIYTRARNPPYQRRHTITNSIRLKHTLWK